MYIYKFAVNICALFTLMHHSSPITNHKNRNVFPFRYIRYEYISKIGEYVYRPNRKARESFRIRPISQKRRYVFERIGNTETHPKG